MSDTPKVIPTAEHARNLEHQRDAALCERGETVLKTGKSYASVDELVRDTSSPAFQALWDARKELEQVTAELSVARRERDEAKAELQEYVTEFQGTSLRNAKSIRAMVDQLTAERDELMRRFTVIGRLIRKALPNICNPEGFPYERTLGIIREHRKLVAERDRLREEFSTAKADASNYKGANISKAAEISQIRAALATAQAEAAAVSSALSKFEKRERGIPQGHMAAELVKELRAALDAASATEGGQS